MTVAVATLAVALAVVLIAGTTVLVRFRRARRIADALLASSEPTASVPEGGLAPALRATEAAPVPGDRALELDGALGVLGERLDALGRAQELRGAWIRRLGEVISLMTQGVVICDAAGDVVFRDDTAISTIPARHGHALVEAALERVLHRARDGVAVEEEVRLYGPPQRVFMLRASALGDGAVALIDDATEREWVETMRRDFVSNISHELRTPVGALSLLAETIADLLADDPDEIATVTGLAERMVSEAERMTRAIEDLAELSRVERDADGERGVLALQDVVGEVAERLANAAEQHGIAVNVLVPSDPVLVCADRRQLASAVHNLLDNALKYSLPGASVSMRVRRGDDLAELSVQDTGIGIPQSDLPRIFERFYRVDRSRTSSSGGIGLGLAIVRHVAINHRGDVSAQSMEGEGSTFTLRIPLGPPSEDRAVPSSESGAAGQPVGNRSGAAGSVSPTSGKGSP